MIRNEDEIKMALVLNEARDDQDNDVYDMGTKEETVSYNYGWDAGFESALEWVLGEIELTEKRNSCNGKT